MAPQPAIGLFRVGRHTGAAVKGKTERQLCRRDAVARRIFQQEQALAFRRFGDLAALYRLVHPELGRAVAAAHRIVQNLESHVLVLGHVAAGQKGFEQAVLARSVPAVAHQVAPLVGLPDFRPDVEVGRQPRLGIAKALLEIALAQQQDDCLAEVMTRAGRVLGHAQPVAIHDGQVDGPLRALVKAEASIKGRDRSVVGRPVKPVENRLGLDALGPWRVRRDAGIQ